MTRLAFTKMQGTGNDFVLLDAIRRPVRVTPGLARRLCERRFGVGADQVLVLGRSRAADFAMGIYNADGSEVEMCGNGIRCLARYAVDRGHTRRRRFSVETRGGIKHVALARGLVRVDMGSPILEAALIPTRARGRVIEAPFRVRPADPGPGERRGVRLELTAISMGNPHAVFFVPEVSRVPLERWGAAVERDPFFPRRTNVEFVEALGPERARVRVWERGSGATLACGTGACAVAVAGVLTGRLHRSVTLSLPGGDLRVEWASDDRVYLTGPAEFVFDGMIDG